MHFGRVDYATLKPLIAAAHTLSPDVVVVSGDLTQRARSEEYMEAREFLEELPEPQIVVPGNHDIPLYNPIARFLKPREKFDKFITSERMPFYGDTDIAIVGVNSSRSFTTKYGRINVQQLSEIENRFSLAEPSAIRCVVTHHPFDLPKSDTHLKQIIGRSKVAMRELARMKIDLFLSGHLHQGFTSGTSTRYKIDHYNALIVQAGTATSTRGRGEPNSFNLILVEPPSIAVKRFVWNPAGLQFDERSVETFERGETGWQPFANRPGEGSGPVAS